MEGDAAALEQVFVNLFVNAAHALPVGGEARVRVSVDDHHVVARVCDNGAGMSPDQLQRITEPFRSSKRGGTGLGLKIARRIVATHRGTLDVTSAVGAGTTVSVSLPRSRSHEPAV